MSEHSPDLIARAAARLREVRAKPGSAIPASPPTPSPSQIGASPPAVQPNLGPRYQGKLIAVDRGALARWSGAPIAGGARTRTSEEFRIIKRQIVLNASSKPSVEEGERHGRLMMVNSTKPREGKTFAAVNLALSLASEQDLRVLLIDLDSHQKSLTKMFGVGASEPGWLDLLVGGTMEFPDVLVRTNIHNLSLMPAGRTSHEAPELLSSKRTAGLLTEMTDRYSDRFIIFDTPPCLASSEPSILAGLVGQIVFLVEADKTEREEIEAALRLISGCSKISLL